MNLDIDYLINFFKKHSGDIGKEEMGEQEAAAAAAPSSTAGGTTSGKSVKKWETGLTRGKSNQIANTKWESGRKFGKTYMNDPKYVWKSDRNLGKTGGSDFA